MASLETTPAFCWGIGLDCTSPAIAPSGRLSPVGSGWRVTVFPSRNENCSNVSKQAFANSSRSLRLDSTSAMAAVTDADDGADMEETETMHDDHKLELDEDDCCSGCCWEELLLLGFELGVGDGAGPEDPAGSAGMACSMPRPSTASGDGKMPNETTYRHTTAKQRRNVDDRNEIVNKIREWRTDGGVVTVWWQIFDFNWVRHSCNTADVMFVNEYEEYKEKKNSL